MNELISTRIERGGVAERQYSGFRLSPDVHDIPTRTIDIFNDIVKGIGAIDQMVSRWNGIPVTRKNALQYSGDIQLCLEIQSRCADVDNIDKILSDLPNRKGNLYIKPEQIRLLEEISTEGPVIREDKQYGSIRWTVERHDDGGVYLCKGGQLMEPNPDKGGKLGIAARTPVTLLDEPKPFDLTALQLKQRELLAQSLEKARGLGAHTELTGQGEQIIHSQKDIAFFRSKLEMIFHDVVNPIAIVVGNVDLHRSNPKILADRIKRTPAVILDVIDIAHKLVHAHEEQVTIPSLREGLQQHAQVAADNERSLRGFKQRVQITVQNNISVLNNELDEVATIPDDALPAFVFSQTIIQAIVENCARNAAKALEAKRRTIPRLLRRIRADTVNPLVTIRFGVDEKRENVYIFFDDHGIGIPSELLQGFQKRVTSWSEGIEGTGVGMATLNTIVKEMCGEDPHKQPRPLRVYPDSNRTDGARIIVKIPLHNVLDV